jgi:hypothetical protein
VKNLYVLFQTAADNLVTQTNPSYEMGTFCEEEGYPEDQDT